MYQNISHDYLRTGIYYGGTGAEGVGCAVGEKLAEIEEELGTIRRHVIYFKH